MKRREAINARVEKREPRRLLESDFLLGVHDEQRMGGIRFKESPSEDFCSNEDGVCVPPWASLRELQYAAWQVQSVDTDNDQEIREWINLLIAPGSSIGGARPKAGVCDEQKHLWIAKFPGRNDEVDVGAWEMLAHRLAKLSGIHVADARIERFGTLHHTFMVKRFDRIVVNGNRRRRHFASAMTMLDYNDGTSFQDGASYLEIVEFLMQRGADIDRDLHQLWRRIVFSICISNTDDHLRNHGFLLQPDGWLLSPAYDMNPNPSGIGLNLNISEDDNSLNLELALQVAEFFRLRAKEAKTIVDEVKKVVGGWSAIANELGIPRAEQQIMRPAFENSQK